MANSTKCLTPDARFSIKINPHKVSVTVRLPSQELSGLTEEEAVILETLIHNQMELVLRPFFS